jgi:ATP-dependent Lhr-like helicase
VLLDERVQRWIWRNEWTELREVQERAIPLILAGEKDVILSSETASGKTEAAFLPILTRMLREAVMPLAIYVSPLTALINDQFGRLLDLCGRLEVPVHPWHGGISASVKKRFFAAPSGVLLITPESLEAMFCNHGFDIPKVFSGLCVVVVDELHSFIGNERGKQVQSLLHLIDVRVKRQIQRVGLSATLGDMTLAADFLSGFGAVKRTCEVVDSGQADKRVKLLLKGILQDRSTVDSEDDTSGDISGDGDYDGGGWSAGRGGGGRAPGAHGESAEEATFAAEHAIAEYLFDKLQHGNNLIFPNSRSKVESYTLILSDMCSLRGVPNRFYAHHGNLSKDIRDEAEAALRAREHSATVICTNTLELGIDIGDVESIVQIGSPPSVASLRQRVGRSGRRQNTQVLRAFTIEEATGARSHIFARLREGTFQMCACILLMLEGWCESPRPAGLHLSTLTQQVLGMVAERGGVFADAAYRDLCVTGPFAAVPRKDFSELLRHLVYGDLLDQDGSGLLLLGEKGERMAAHFSFYAAFTSENEYRIVNDGQTLGTLPISTGLQVNDFIIFAGKSLRVTNINEENRTVEVKFYGHGQPPVFTGGGFRIDPAVRTRMRALYESDFEPPFADSNTREFLREGREAYRAAGLAVNDLVEQGRDTVIVTWLGDYANRTLKLLLKRHDINSETGGLGLTVPSAGIGEVRNMLARISAEPEPPIESLLSNAHNLRVAKWDWALPKKLLFKNYASLYLAFDEVREWLDNRTQNQ